MAKTANGGVCAAFVRRQKTKRQEAIQIEPTKQASNMRTYNTHMHTNTCTCMSVCVRVCVFESVLVRSLVIQMLVEHPSHGAILLMRPTVCRWSCYCCCSGSYCCLNIILQQSAGLHLALCIHAYIYLCMLLHDWRHRRSCSALCRTPSSSSSSSSSYC